MPVKTNKNGIVTGNLVSVRDIRTVNNQRTETIRTGTVDAVQYNSVGVKLDQKREDDHCDNTVTWFSNMYVTKVG